MAYEGPHPLPVPSGGTAATTLTDGGILLGSGTSAVTLTAQPTDGQILIGSTGVDPALGSITSTHPTLTVTAGAGTLNLDLTTNIQDTAIHSWNSSILEKASSTVTSDGATITYSIEQDGGGNLTVVFSDGFYSWTTAPATIALTAGTDTSPVTNYVYLLQSTKTLTVSTTSFPATEAARLAEVICQSAPSMVAQFPYMFQSWVDDVVEATGMGHISDLTFWIRNQNATWIDGIVQTFTITPNGGAPDNVILTTTSGNVLQLHDNAFPAFAGTPDVYVINDSATPYTMVTDLNALLTDSTGASMSGKYFSLVIWGVVSQNTGDCKLFCNLPSGSYNSSATVTADASKFATYTIPIDYKNTGFLIAQWDLRHQTAASGTWTSINEIDLRGQVPSLGAGGATAFPNEFIDNVFRILDDADNSKEIAFQAANITTATTRTITMVDADLDLATVSNSFPTDSGTAAPTANALTIAGGTNINTSGATTIATVNLDATLTGLTSVTSTTFLGTTYDTNVAAAGVTLVGTTLGADGSDANIDIEITPKGTGVLLTSDIGNAADTSAIVITAAGEVTMPLQPAFLATHTVAQLNVTGNATIATVNYTTEVYDQNADYDGTNTFTAPVTGNYDFEASVFISSIGAGTQSRVFLVTSNRSYSGSLDTPIGGSSVCNLGAVAADMDAADTCIARGQTSGTGADTADFGASAADAWFSGTLTC